MSATFHQVGWRPPNQVDPIEGDDDRSQEICNFYFNEQELHKDHLARGRHGSSGCSIAHPVRSVRICYPTLFRSSRTRRINESQSEESNGRNGRRGHMDELGGTK